MSTTPEEQPELALELSLSQIEVIKWHQRLQEITYLEAGQHMRALNQLMWQVPSLVIIINGGLWYGLTMMSNFTAHFIFAFCLLFDLASIVTLYRLRKLISAKIDIQSSIEKSYNEKILSNMTKGILKEKEIVMKTEKQPKEPEENHKKSKRTRVFEWMINKTDGSYTVISCWSLSLAFCSLINAIGVCSPALFLDNEPKKIKHEFYIDKPYVIIDTNQI
ncbi:hypothetical protein [Klebsiella aerogenes]|uniref:hypothetical protein n=2 Tax=Klebsiella aerogenes TaxID=548 RepID=UPI002DBF4719|nr:hypothetical protein [Klebsiella aerogenes]MEB7532446.1 hypothetical protein [Klebsiella aerogenes]HBV4557679.1 hypothetical protein [Klebsiella aerogenes]HCM3125301.1 hypothetical protein [Klebsiella aerogenes]